MRNEDEETVDATSEPVLILEPEADRTTTPETTPPVPKILPETLKAKALYKNADGLEIRNTIEFGNGHRGRSGHGLTGRVRSDKWTAVVSRLLCNRLLLHCPSIELWLCC